MSTSSDYNLASRQNPCPVCGAVSGCKELATATQLTWFCRAVSGTAKGDKIPGVDGQLWHSFGPAGDGIWGQLSPDRKQIFSEADKTKHDAELARKRVEVERLNGKHSQKQKIVLEEALREKWREEGVTCIKCPIPADTVDHIIPEQLLIQFGIDTRTHFDEENLSPMCRRCNGYKSYRLDFTIPQTKALLLKYIEQVK